MYKLSKKVITTLLLAAVFASSVAQGVGLPSGFVDLGVVDPSIRISLKYHSKDNITGRPLKGCRGNRAIVTLEAAEALRNIQEDLVMHGYSLLVYNAYHPERAYKHIDSWIGGNESIRIKEEYYPNISKADLLRGGYIAAKAAHVRGSTVDVSVISLDKRLKSPCTRHKRSYRGQNDVVFVNDNSLDMGTSFDLFDPLSEYSNELLPEKARKNRKFLRDSMQNHGFIQSGKFWWQFTLVREPYADSKFDFDV